MQKDGRKTFKCPNVVPKSEIYKVKSHEYDIFGVHSFHICCNLISCVLVSFHVIVILLSLSLK